MLSNDTSEVEEVTQAYRVFLSELKDLLGKNKDLNLGYNMKVITDHLVSKYLKLDMLKKDAVGKADEVLNEKLAMLRLTGYSSKFNAPANVMSMQLIKQSV